MSTHNAEQKTAPLCIDSDTVRNHPALHRSHIGGVFYAPFERAFDARKEGFHNWFARVVAMDAQRHQMAGLRAMLGDDDDE
jgi:hypothetical protein